jgi:hypothetical protein
MSTITWSRRPLLYLVHTGPETSKSAIFLTFRSLIVSLLRWKKKSPWNDQPVRLPPPQIMPMGLPGANDEGWVGVRLLDRASERRLSWWRVKIEEGAVFFHLRAGAIFPQKKKSWRHHEKEGALESSDEVGWVQRLEVFGSWTQRSTIQWGGGNRSPPISIPSLSHFLPINRPNQPKLAEEGTAYTSSIRNFLSSPSTHTSRGLKACGGGEAKPERAVYKRRFVQKHCRNPVEIWAGSLHLFGLVTVQ